MQACGFEICLVLEATHLTLFYDSCPDYSMSKFASSITDYSLSQQLCVLCSKYPSIHHIFGLCSGMF